MKIKHSKLLLGLVMFASMTVASQSYAQLCFVEPVCEEYESKAQTIADYYNRIYRKGGTAEEWMSVVLANRSVVRCLQMCYDSETDRACFSTRGAYVLASEAQELIQVHRISENKAAKLAPSRVREIKRLGGDEVFGGDDWMDTDFVREDLPRMGITIKGDLDGCADISGIVQ